MWLVYGLGWRRQVGLSHEEVQCKETFISRTNNQTFKVINNGAAVVRFAFKQHQSPSMDAEAQMRRSMELTDAAADSQVSVDEHPGGERAERAERDFPLGQQHRLDHPG